jgi:predicted DNA-binding protein with PD1-like motif
LRTRLLHESGGLRTFVVIFDKGDEALGGLTDFAREEDLTGASLTAVGAFSRATLAYFDPELMDYVDISVDNQAEVLSMIGDVALADGGPEVHAHVVVGHRDGSTSGGHLRKADVFPTLEVVITETPAHLRKRHDPQTGLTLIDPEK